MERAGHPALARYRQAKNAHKNSEPAVLMLHVVLWHRPKSCSWSIGHKKALRNECAARGRLAPVELAHLSSLLAQPESVQFDEVPPDVDVEKIQVGYLGTAGNDRSNSAPLCRLWRPQL